MAGFSSDGPLTAERIVSEARKAFFVVFALLVVVWSVQIVNWADDYGLSRDFGIESREPGDLGGILAAPLLHWSWAHIESNSGPLFVFGFLAAYRGVWRFLGLTLLTAFTSGAAVWLFAAEGTVTAGASGILYGYMGYVVLRGIFDRHLIDSLIGVVMAASFAYTLSAAVPGTPGVSWLGHLGGLVGGIAGAWFLRDRKPRPEARDVPPAGRDVSPGGAPDTGAGGQLPSGGGRLPSGGPDGGSKAPPRSGGSGKDAADGAGSGSRSDLYKELRDQGLM